MKKNLQQKKFLVTLLALCLSMGAKAQTGQLIDLDTYPLDLRAQYPTELMYNTVGSESAQHKITFGATGYGDGVNPHWVVKQHEPATYTFVDEHPIEGMEGSLTWTLEYYCENDKEYTCQGQGKDKIIKESFMIIGDKDRAEMNYAMFSVPINKDNVYVGDVAIELTNDGKVDADIKVELLHKTDADEDFKVVASESRPLPKCYGTGYAKERFSFDISKYGVGTCAIRLTGAEDIRVFNISYVGTAKPYVEVLTTDYKYASMYYSEYNLITPEKAAYTIEGSGATVESSEAPVPATYVYSDGVLQETTTYAPGEIIPKGTAVVVKGTPGCVYRFYAVPDPKTPNDPQPKQPEASDLRGTDKAEETTGGTYYYALSLNPKNEVNSVGFYWMNWSYIEEDGKSIVVGGKPFINGAHKAYLALDEQPAGHEIKNHFLFNEISSGIENVEQEEGVKTIYNLAGQRLTKMQKGINIVNGKKVLVK